MHQLSQVPRYGFEVSFGFSNEVINDAMKKLVGVRITPIDPPEKFPDAYLEVTSLKLHSNVGMSNLEIGLKLVSPSRNLTVKLKGEGALLFDKAVDGKNDVIPLVVKLRDIKSGFSWRFFSVSNSGLLDDYVTIETVKSLEDSLKIELPRVSLGGPTLNLNEDVTNENENPPSQLTIRLDGPKVDLVSQVSLAALVFGKNGITAHANLDTEASVIPPTPPVAERDIASEVKRLQSVLLEVPAINRVFDEDAWVQVTPKAFASIIGQFNSLSSEEQRIDIRTLSHEGKLFEDQWRDDTLGDGGIIAEFTGSNPVTGQVQPGPINYSLVDDGLSYFMDLDISARAKVKTHFDPIVGGGIGKIWSLRGSAKPRLEGKLEVFLDNSGSTPMAVVRNTPVCSSFDLTVKDSGDLEVGVRTNNLIGDQAPTVNPIIDGIPIVLSLMNKNNTEDFRVDFPEDYMIYEYSPTRFSLNEDGLSLGLDLNGSYSSSAPDIKALKNSVSQRLTVLENESPKSICPELDSMVVLIAGLEFGENNEFVKIGKFLVEQATAASDTIINELDSRQRNLINPRRDSALHKPADKPLKTLECVVTLFSSC